MLGQIRSFAKSPIATILLGLVMVSFVIFGIRGASTSVGARDEVVKAGARAAITSEGFRSRFNFFKQQIEQQNQRTIPIDEALKLDLDHRIVDELAYSESFSELIHRDGVRPADALVAEKLRSFRSLFNPITGAFDKTAYAQLLAQNNMTAAQLESELRDEIAERQAASGLAAGLRSPYIYAALQAAYLQEQRAFDWFVVSPKILGAPPKPTDAELNAFIKTNAQRLMKPEMRQLSVLHIDGAALGAKVTPSPKEVQSRFDFEKDSLSTPEKRTFVQAPLSDPQLAEGVIARLKAASDPAAAAKIPGLQLVPYAQQPRSGIPDKGVASAAFTMSLGEARLVQGDFGPSVVRLFAVEPGREATLAEARPKVEAEVRAAAGVTEAYQEVRRYTDARGGGADMAAAAKSIGEVPQALAPITAKGVSLEGQPAGLPPKVLQAAFALAPGADSKPIDVAKGDYYVVHLDKVLPPAVPSLEEIRPKLTQYVILRDAAQKLQEKADALSAAIRKGESLQDAAKSVGAEVSHADGVLRNGAGPLYSADLLSRVFAARPKALVVGEDVRLGFAVARLDAVTPAAPGVLAPVMAAQRPEITKSLYEDLVQDARAAARAEIRPHLDYARARKAVAGAADPGVPGL